MATATLGDIPFVFDPDAVTWNFRMRASTQSTIGGRVIQVFGTDLGDMTVTAQLGAGDSTLGEREGWQAAERMMSRIKALAKATEEDRKARPVRFRVPSMNWGFLVYVKNVDNVTHTVDTISPSINLTLFIVEDITKTVTSGITDKYIERLMKGIGWAQSEYNGPTADEVDELLAPYGGSVTGYMQGQVVQIFSDAMGGTGVGQPGQPVFGAEGINKYLYALRMVESGGDYTAQNPYSTASGAYQYIDSTWARYKGYQRAKDAPPAIQDERAARDANAAYDRYGNWGAAATIHFTGHYVDPNSPEYTQVPGHWSNKTVKDYVDQIYAYMGEAP